MNSIKVKDFVESQSPLSNLAHLNSPNCDRCVLNLLRQHLIQADKHSYTVTQRQPISQKQPIGQKQPILPHCQQVVEQMGWILVTNDGQVQLMIPRAEQLLSQYFLFPDSQALPEPLQHWFKHQIAQLPFKETVPSPDLFLRMEQSEQQLIVRLVPNPLAEHYLLLLEEQKLSSFSIAALELLGLTKREAEVLFWIAKDKSNAGIAKVLGCCEGTIRKHLENLYKKLGVQTRTGAVMAALEKLGLFKGEFVAMSS